MIRILCVVLFFLTACGAAELGESCDESGETDECVDGAVCTDDSGGTVCRQICEEKEDCPKGFNCNGTKGSLKSCQPS